MKLRLTLPLWLEIALAILIALSLTNAATIFLLRGEGERRIQHFGEEIRAQRLASAANVVLKAPEVLRADLVRALSTPDMRLSLDAKPLPGEVVMRKGGIETRWLAPGVAPPGAARGVAASTAPGPGDGAGVLRFAPESGGAASGGHVFHLAPGSPPPGLLQEGAGPPPEPPPVLVMSTAVGPGRWLNARFGMSPPRAPTSPFIWVAAATLGALLLVSLWIGGRVTQPLQRLAEAATSLRRGELRNVVPETGPAPVREAARSFNAMSERVMTMLKSQRAMMAAVAHDLRTPIAVLRFRAELVNDAETRAKLIETIGEMQDMTEAVLDAVRFDGSSEAARAVDIGALVESLCVDMTEVGAEVAYRPNGALACVCRAAEVRRALRNLIENAVRYGGRARVSVAARDDVAEIQIDDDGPGIPESHLERVFEPFARLDESRSKETGGYGLGLAIARLIARGHGGDVTLANRAGGGLRATLILPAER